MKLPNLITLRLTPLLAASAFAIGVLVAGGGAAPTAQAASCPATTCMRVDAIAGGGIDESASVSGDFTVDIVLQGSTGIDSFNLNLAYNPQVLRAGLPTSAGLQTAAFGCSDPPPSGALDQGDGGADHDPATAEAFFSCVNISGVSSLQDGPIAHVPFTVVSAGTSPLHLIAVAAADSDSITRIACDFEGTSQGACTDAVVSTTGGAPPPPPASGDQCTVAYALDGETVQCVDGSRVRFAGVASPLGSGAGADWATALTQWFLAGKTLTLETDASPFDQFGSRFGYPHITGSDGADYNISALLIYVGMAHHLSDGVNVRNDAWFDAAQVWARTACWNMWAAGNPFSAESGCR